MPFLSDLWERLHYTIYPLNFDFSGYKLDDLIQKMSDHRALDVLEALGC